MICKPTEGLEKTKVMLEAMDCLKNTPQWTANMIEQLRGCTLPDWDVNQSMAVIETPIGLRSLA